MARRNEHRRRRRPREVSAAMVARLHAAEERVADQRREFLSDLERRLIESRSTLEMSVLAIRDLHEVVQLRAAARRERADGGTQTPVLDQVQYRDVTLVEHILGLPLREQIRSIWESYIVFVLLISACAYIFGSYEL